MQSIDPNLFPNAQIQDRLNAAQSANLCQVTYMVAEAKQRIGPYNVSSLKPVTPQELERLVEAVGSPTAYHQQFVTRHRPTPQFIVDVINPIGPLVVLIDQRGGKLGFLIDGVEMARDYVPDTPNILTLGALINAYATVQGPEQ